MVGTRQGYLTPPPAAAKLASVVTGSSRTPDRAARDRVVGRLNRDARRIAERFGLRFRAVVAERAGVKRRYGACFEDGTIKIRLVRVGSGAPLRYSSLVDTLCHELAHLKYWHHGPGFQAYYERLLAFARAEGIYAPQRRGARTRAPEPASRSAAPAASRPVSRAPRPGRPEQLSLFGPGG